VNAFRPSRWPAVLRVAGPALLLPAAVTGMAALPVRISTTTAALVFVLAVTGAAVIGGSGAGLAASLLSFLALNFSFTPPLGTLSVRKTADLVALVVFLLVSAVVGTLVSRANTQRQRAERREREARILQHLGTRLLSGESAETVLESFGRALVDLTGLARYEAALEPDGQIRVQVGEEATAGMARTDFPLEVGGQAAGAIRTYRHAEAVPLGEGERHLIRTFTSQMALALESNRLAGVARGAQLDAERSQLQAALFSSVTHDLRTPLASITASVTSLLDSAAEFRPEDRRTLLETILQEAERLNRLVRNLLDLSRLRAGALTPSKRPTAIDELIEGVLSRMEPLLLGHRLNVVLRDNLPEVPADAVQIDQVLTNLLENAAKFSPPGSQITISAARWQNNVQVRVADRGRPIPPEERERVFEPFVQAENGNATGSGLGLAIARAVVVAHGGAIWIEDAPGGGTAVVFRLPVAQPS
jgi:two-component system, OmpR family, sensor histidine kinase KdpD